MPNLCDTTYKCVGDLKDVRSLYKIIKANDKRKTPRIKSSFGTLWLGCIINALGFEWEKHRCRGKILDYQLEDNVLTISQETAWCEQEGFRECIEKKYLSIKVYYQEQEPGCDVFYTNDNSGIYFPDRQQLRPLMKHWRTIWKSTKMKIFSIHSMSSKWAIVNLFRERHTIEVCFFFLLSVTK